ncbi:DUF1796 family putative cysteine peptidase [Niallia taxi]|uniref:DUF1796 family putative cysteine peptidase n=1 Tax=Niallia taxi TaxID=2499688 RepID=UPI0011A27A69|nr:DUF1796 family putative cysteine peptidase [Niallia taxi]MCT2346911.1 papain-like cysteine peptidase [Niallia taxi]MDE5053015.1 DUF1796 family putative cysteine peptidase [Niallia taxi]MED3963658.1 DUF1796 family putative cysteine peptidase [Niallia taxi]WOD61595.1 papain-like cysteine peptidase [Niallia taxi]
MKLNEIKGEYDAVYSLGENCLPAMKMRQFHLRPFAGPLDWVGIQYVHKVAKLIRTYFTDFLAEENLVPTGYASDSDLLVYDIDNIISFNHDFKTDRNTLDNLMDLPVVKEKYYRRITRFIQSVQTDNRILFIRTVASIEEIIELQSALREVVKGDFTLLVINHYPITELIEQECYIENVCSICLPNEDIWDGNNHHWQQIFNGISIRSK